MIQATANGQVVATMPAADAKRVAQVTAQVTGKPVTELDIASILLGARIGDRGHISQLSNGNCTLTETGRAALQDLTVWIDGTSLYVVKGNTAPSAAARLLGAPPPAGYAASVLKHAD